MFDNSEYKQKMQNLIAHFQDELKKIRTGRAHPDMLSSVKVEAYGQFMPINQVANVTASGGTMLLVTPFDPSTITNISNAIRNEQSLGLNPSDDGHVVRVPVPPLTEERRKEIVKMASGKVEDAKIAIRNVREEARKELKEAKLPEDTTKRAEKEIDDLTKDFVNQVDEQFKIKSKEIMEI